MKGCFTLAALVLASSLFVAGSAQAGADIGSWYVAPKAVYFNPDRLQRVVDAAGTTSYKVSNSLGSSIGFGKVLNQNWDIDVSYVYSLHNAGAESTSYKSLEFVASRVFLRDRHLSPFVSVGLNNTRFSLTTVNSQAQAPIERSSGYLLKIGTLTDLSSVSFINKLPFVKVINSDGTFQIVTELGWRADGSLKNNDKLNIGTIRQFENTFFGLGLHYNFGKHAETRSAPELVAAPVEQAPLPPPVPAPEEAKLVPPPPPADTDRDGVVDPSDRCADTPAGDKVDADGCSLTMVLDVQFDTGKATIKPESNAHLDEFVQFLKNVPTVKGVLEGHTDNVGDKLANQKLSERRAEAVKAYVVSRDIDADRLVTKGYGDFKPIADNATAEGRAANRRVQFTH